MIEYINSVNSVSFIVNGKFLVLGSGDIIIRFWNLLFCLFLNYNGSIVDFDFILDGKEIVIISNVS